LTDDKNNKKNDLNSSKNVEMGFRNFANKTLAISESQRVYWRMSRASRQWENILRIYWRKYSGLSPLARVLLAKFP